MIKLVAEMSLQELAAYVATHLKSRQLPVVLVGGSCSGLHLKPLRPAFDAI
jgi:hypothetical protein